MTRIAIVNYGMGNLRSVEKALAHVGVEPVITSGEEEITAADGLILPGVGAFPEAMRRIGSAGLDAIIRERADSGVPLLGICLGMQLLFDSTTENEGADGLGLLPGPVEALEVGELKLPHIGWAPVQIEGSSPLSDGIDDSEPFYFVHSFAPRPEPEALLGSAAYGERFAALVGRHPIYGAQFHPEKSSTAGLALLERFAAICTPAQV